MGSWNGVDQPLMTPALQVEHSPEAARHARGVPVIRTVAVWAWRTGATACASVIAFPRPVRMVLTHPSAVFAERTRHKRFLAHSVIVI
jgi:hypothetical protein